MAERSLLVPLNVVSNSFERVLFAKLQSSVLVSELATEYVPSRFSMEYLQKYFPRMPVIAEQLLPTMCPRAALNMVRDIVWFVHDTPAHYFSNTQFPLYRVHHEVLRDQLAELLRILECTCVIGAHAVIVHDIPVGDQSLLQYAQTNNDDAGILLTASIADYAVRFCYLAVRFNVYSEGYIELERLQKYRRCLRGTPFEKEYHEISSHYATLIDMLRARLWGSSAGKELLW